MNDDMQFCEIGINENEDNTQLMLRCVWRILLDLMRNVYLRQEIGPTIRSHDFKFQSNQHS